VPLCCGQFQSEKRPKNQIVDLIIDERNVTMNVKCIHLAHDPVAGSVKTDVTYGFGKGGGGHFLLIREILDIQRLI
jgi:hypothetical protein